MKHIFILLTATLLCWGCKKDLSVSSDPYTENVKKGLQDSLTKNDFTALDFSHALKSEVDSMHLYILRVPFKETIDAADFVIVRTDATGTIERGQIIHQEGRATENSTKKLSWNGRITICSLSGKEQLTSPIENGYITALHQTTLSRTLSLEVPGVMPEVIITYTIHSSGNSWAPFMNLQSYFYDNGGNTWGGYYGTWDWPTGGGGGGGGNSGPNGNSGDGGPGYTGLQMVDGGGGYVESIILVDEETGDKEPPIDIEKFINCMNAIPDAGASCSIEIMSDIPVDSDPNKIFNVKTGSPGHTFLNIRKSNATSSVSQNIGFYPKSGYKVVLSTAPVDGKFVDNGEHEFNCGFIQNITPAQLHSVITKMQQVKNMKYNIDDYNCTDWALDVFNAAGAYTLVVPRYDIPDDVTTNGTRMPNSVYNKLAAMKAANDPQTPNIHIGFLKGLAGHSTGPCN